MDSVQYIVCIHIAINLWLLPPCSRTSRCVRFTRGIAYILGFHVLHLSSSPNSSFDKHVAKPCQFLGSSCILLSTLFQGSSPSKSCDIRFGHEISFDTSLNSSDRARNQALFRRCNSDRRLAFQFLSAFWVLLSLVERRKVSSSEIL